MCGPTGVGVLYGKEAWLNKLPPYQGGGEMIETVTFEKTTYAGLPHKFEVSLIEKKEGHIRRFTYATKKKNGHL